MKVALIHDWLVAHRGGEQVLLELARIFPNAPIYTLVHDPAGTHPELRGRVIHSSWVGKLKGDFRKYLPLFPLAIQNFDLKQFDLLLSTSHCVVKGVRTRGGQAHLSYIHSPMRYLYDQRQVYLSEQGRIKRYGFRAVAPVLKRWDRWSSKYPTRMVANSKFVAQRIERVWGRQVDNVIYPPVDIEYFERRKQSHNSGRRRGFLFVGALVPYKRAELAIAWANRFGYELSVIGAGPEKRRLQRLAGSTVRFLGSVGRADLRHAYANAEALIFPGEEDFGIIPVEAMAAGCPVLAYGRGGALETVGPSPIGELFEDLGVESIEDALQRWKNRAQKTDPFELESQFGVSRFRSAMEVEVQATLRRS